MEIGSRLVFSERSAFEREPNALARAVAAARARGAPLVDLTESNPTAAGFAAPRELLAALAHPRAAYYEPHPLGHPEARAAVARELARARRATSTRIGSRSRAARARPTRSRSGCSAIRATASSSRGRATRCSTTSRAPTASSSSPTRCSTTAPGRSTARDLRERARDPRVRAVVCVNPNNPTGSFASRDATPRHLAELALPIVSDEVFSAYAFAATRARASAPRCGDGALPLVLALGGLSKYAGLPQLKLAWAVAAGREAPEALARLEILADAYLSVATPVQLALAEIFALAGATRAAIAARLARNLAQLARAVAALPRRCCARRAAGTPCCGCPLRAATTSGRSRCSSSTTCSCSRAGSTTSRAGRSRW